MTHQHIHENDDYNEAKHEKQNLISLGWIVIIVEVPQKRQEENANHAVSKSIKSGGFIPPVIIPSLTMVIISQDCV